MLGALVVLLLAYAVLVPLWRYHVHRWEVTESAVYTQTGWWARERRIAPMSRVQTVDHREGAIARLFGLATVRITTASSAGALTIEGLDRSARSCGGGPDPDGRLRSRRRDLMDPFDQVAGWHRLDRRMLLVHPVREVGRFLPVLIGLLLFGRGSDGGTWALIGIAIPVALGLLRYLTTSYRLTAGRVEVRSGLLNKQVVSTPLDRVRTVDLTASPIHRALGLVTLRVGTGRSADKGDGKLDLDGLSVNPRPSSARGCCGSRRLPTPTRSPGQTAGWCSPSTPAGCASLP